MFVYRGVFLRELKLLVFSENKMHPPSHTFNNARSISLRGVTLIEVTVIILVLLGIIAILFFASLAWQRGIDRSVCILNLRQVQIAARSYQNFNERDFGTPVMSTELIGNGLAIDSQPICPDPTNGINTFTPGYVFKAFFPPTGTLYMECNLRVSQGHHPKNTAGW